MFQEKITKQQATQQRQFDLICLGRLAVDLYGDQFGVELEDVRSFTKYLGGSSANIAAGCARLGLRVSMLSRVGDEQMGRFLLSALQKEGCDTSMVKIDKKRLTALAILSIRDSERFPLLFYRENCADMAIAQEDIHRDHIASSRALLITGTHFSTDKVMGASLRALDYAKTHDTLRILDIDYRPVLWNLTDKGDGDTRFIASKQVTDHMQAMLPHFDLVVGTEEEICIAGGNQDTIESLKAIRKRTQATLLVKRGAKGCAIVEGKVPEKIEDALVYEGFRINVLNVLGAGDAFLAGFLFGVLRSKSYEACCTIANACGALVVSRHACSPAMPTPAELDYFLQNKHAITSKNRIDKDEQLNLLHRMSKADRSYNNMVIMALDHRSQLIDLARKTGVELTTIPLLKNLLAESFLQVVDKYQLHYRAGMLIDDAFGTQALYKITGSGVWIARPVEQPSSRPLEFEGGRNIGLRLVHWSGDHIVKCLVFYHPDDQPQLRYEQERQISELYKVCCAKNLQLLLEIIPPQGIQGNTPIERSIERLYNLGIHPHWWKLPPLSTMNSWQNVTDLIHKRSPFCKGVLLLGLNDSLEQLAKAFRDAAQFSICKGFAVGRTLFYHEAEQWFRGFIDNSTLQTQVANNYLALINAWDNRH